MLPKFSFGVVSYNACRLPKEGLVFKRRPFWPVLNETCLSSPTDRRSISFGPVGGHGYVSGRGDIADVSAQIVRSCLELEKNKFAFNYANRKASFLTYKLSKSQC